MTTHICIWKPLKNLQIENQWFTISRGFSWYKGKHFCTQPVNRSWKQVPQKVTSRHNQVDTHCFQENLSNPAQFQAPGQQQRENQARPLPSKSLHSKRENAKHIPKEMVKKKNKRPWLEITLRDEEGAQATANCGEELWGGRAGDHRGQREALGQSNRKARPIHSTLPAIPPFRCESA